MRYIGCQRFSEDSYFTKTQSGADFLRAKLIFPVNDLQKTLYSYSTHATFLPSTFLSSGTCSLHFAVQYWHLVEKGQPDGTSIGLGTSPFKITRFIIPAAFGDATGMDAINAFV